MKNNGNMSIQKMARGPVMLIDREFNIPLFNAETQMYICTDVSEIATSPGGKDYTIHFSEVKQKYSVPERVDIDLFIPSDGNGGLAHVTMNEVSPKRGDIKLSQTLTPKENITTLAGLKKIFYEMAKKM
jgi:hypothetical protein